jgi:hypothetical protein
MANVSQIRPAQAPSGRWWSDRELTLLLDAYARGVARSVREQYDPPSAPVLTLVPGSRP